ncbi:MAG: imelysin family protein [Pseudomonadota bacterium]
MLKRLSFICALALASPALSQSVDAVVDEHVLPGYQALVDATAALSDVAQMNCDPGHPDLQEAYHAAFDAWTRVSHLRFGPSETDQRAFALAFWPDPRGSTQKTLAALISDNDPVIETVETFATVSVAARGFYALEFLLFEPSFATMGEAEYRCGLIIAVAREIASNSALIQSDWKTEYAGLMRNAGENDTFRTEQEALRQLFTALSTGLEFTADVRLGRPLGTFDRPRPKRAEARRSQRSLRNVLLALEGTRPLAALLSQGGADLDALFERALERGEGIDDPVFANVAEPQGRIRVEALQQNINLIRQEIAEELGPKLGVAAGFNSLDGD